MNMDKLIVGSFELVSFPDLGVYDVIAKIDTGAYSGAINCSNIRVTKRWKDGKRILRFKPIGKKAASLEYEDFKEAYVRSATGHRVKRYLIETKLIIKGQEYNTTIGLADRTDMKKHILIGRRFLHDNGIIVDVAVNSEYDDRSENNI